MVRVEGNTIQLLSEGPPLKLVPGYSNHKVCVTWATNGITKEIWWCLRPQRLLRQPPPPPSDKNWMLLERHFLHSLRMKAFQDTVVVPISRAVASCPSGVFWDLLASAEKCVRDNLIWKTQLLTPLKDREAFCNRLLQATGNMDTNSWTLGKIWDFCRLNARAPDAETHPFWQFAMVFPSQLLPGITQLPFLLTMPPRCGLLEGGDGGALEVKKLLPLILYFHGAGSANNSSSSTNNTGGPSGMSCCERPSSGDQVAAAGAHLCTRITQNRPSAGGDPTWGRTCMVTWTTSSCGGECVAARQHLAVQHRWRTGQCRIAAWSYSALGVAVHHRWRTGQGRTVAAHSSHNSEFGGTAWLP
jgi:hypothetical protein